MLAKTIGFGIVAFTLLLNSSHLMAQAAKWDQSFISNHAVVTGNINVARLLKNNKESKSVASMIKHCKERHNVKLQNVDHFQAVFSNDPKLQPGPDNSTSTKLVFLKPVSIDAETISKMTRYTLEPKKYGEQTLFAGKRKGHWGGMPPNSQSITFGVESMLKSILDSPKVAKLNKAHDLSRFDKTNVDICITLSGGQAAQEFAKTLLGNDAMSGMLKVLDEGVAYLDTQADDKNSPLTVKLLALNEEGAKKIKTELEFLIASGKQSSQSMIEMFKKGIEKMERQEAPPIVINNSRKQMQSFEYYAAVLGSLKIEQKEKVVWVKSSDKANLSKLPEQLVNLFLG